MSKTVKVTYNSNTLETVITVDGKEFDTSRINGREIADWAYPFMMRKVKWNGFYEEMVEALDGEKEFNLVFDGPDGALEELKEAWEDAPVHIIEESEKSPAVIIEYNADTLTTNITVNGQPFDTSRINGREIEDWVYPFQIRKVKWNGIFEELSVVVDSENFTIEFVGDEKWINILREKCPENITICLSADLNEAIKWYTKAANAGHKEAKTALQEAQTKLEEESCYTKAVPIQEENKKTESAEELYHQADVCDDEEEAFRLLKKSADLGYAEAQCLIGQFYYLGEIVDEDDEQAYNYYKKAAEQNNAEAQYWMGELYYNGYGVKEDESEAVKWYRKSANNGFADAMLSLGDCYFYGEGVKKNIQEAISWYKKGADKGDSGCQYALANCYWNGNGVKENKGLAFSLFEKSAEQGYALANNKLGLIYDEGEYKKADVNKAIEYYQRAADAELAVAMYNLGANLYIEMNDVDKAIEWLEKALEAGYENAQEMLDRIDDETNGFVADEEEMEIDLSDEYGLEIDFDEPLDVFYDIKEHEDYRCFFKNKNNLYPYGNNIEKNFVYSLFFYIDVESGDGIINIMNAVDNYVKTGETEYQSATDFFNTLTGFFELSEENDTEDRRAKKARMIVDKLYSYDATNSMIKVLEDVCETVEEMRDFVNGKYNDMDDFSDNMEDLELYQIYYKMSVEKYSETAEVLGYYNDRLYELLKEIKSNMRDNKNKIFSYFNEVGDYIIKVLHFKLDFADAWYECQVERYEQDVKSSNIKGNVAAFVGGFSIIGAKKGIDYANKLDNELSEQFDNIRFNYAELCKGIIYLSIIMLAFENISGLAFNLLVDDYDIEEDENDFFDQI